MLLFADACVHNLCGVCVLGVCNGVCLVSVLFSWCVCVCVCVCVVLVHWVVHVQSTLVLVFV